MKKAFILFIIISALVGLVSWKKYQGNHQSVQVSTELVSQKVLSDTILASGNLIFNSQIQIRSQVTGIVTQVLVEEGDLVQQGQILMQLDQTAFAADVANAQATVNAQNIAIEQATEFKRDIERRLQRKNTLFQQQLIGQEDIDTLTSQNTIASIKVKAAKARLNQKKANLALAQDRLTKTTFVAAIDGLISAVDVKPGETVIAGTTNIIGSALMTLADPATILAELRIDEADINNVQKGQVVEVFAAATPKNPIVGEIINIGTSARTNANGQGLHFRVKALLNPGKRLYPGMSCRAEIITAQAEPSLSVPIGAIQSNDSKNYVWLVKNNTAVKQSVHLGMSTDTDQAITSGLQLNDIVITGPNRTIKSLTDGAGVSENKRQQLTDDHAITEVATDTPQKAKSKVEES
jgi:HlyD family secretion protein